MAGIIVHDLIPKRLLTSRGSVEAVVPRLIQAAVGGNRPITLDFEGIDGVAPSVLDQLIISLTHLLPTGSTNGAVLIFDHVPADLGRKYQAVARAHRRRFVIQEDGAWALVQQEAE